MNLFQTTASSRTLSDNQWREWNQAIFKIFRQIWLITLVVELLLWVLFYWRYDASSQNLFPPTTEEPFPCIQSS